MRATKYLLVIMGVLGMLASIYLGIVDKEIMPNISLFIVSLSLVYLGMYKVVPPSSNCKIEVEKAKDSF